MIVTNEVEIRIVGRNLKYYNDRGYDCNVKDIIKVKVKDLPPNSRVLIDYKCDYCNTLYTHGYNVYMKSIKSNGKKSCRSCKNIKIEETNMERYGVNRPLQNDNIYKKYLETNMAKYGVDIATKLKHISNKTRITHKNKYIEVIKTLNIGKFLKINNFGTYDILCDKCNKVYEFNPSKSGCTRIYNNKTPCYHCLPINKTLAEIEIVDFIKTIYTGEILINKRKLINPYELDIYLPDLNLAVEFNGLYWHSDIYKDKDYHLNKTNMCKNVGVQLIHVWEDEWVNKQDIIKSILIKNINYKLLDKHFARKCKIIDVNSKDAKLFFNKFHIQGHRNSKYYYGLTHNNELVSVISFNNSTGIFIKNKENIPEVVRFCTNNSIVIGGLNRLLKHFVRTTGHKKIISYVDYCKFNGAGYISSGFKIISSSKPGYHYSKNNLMERIHRYNFNKSKLVKMGYDKNKSESQIMSELDYFKIYDCGQIKLLYEI